MALVSAVVINPAESKDIEGQIFIVTAGAQAIKLPLVPVLIIPKAEIEKRINEVELQIAPERTKADAALSQASKEVKHGEQAIAGGFGRWMMSLQKTQPKDPTGQSWADPRTEALRYNAAKDHLPKARERLNVASARQKLLHSAAPYFVDLPGSIATTKTDADGRFKLNLPDEGDFAVVASSTRAVFNTVEKYFWVIRLKPQDSTLTLSNDNLTSSGSADSMLTTKE